MAGSPFGFARGNLRKLVSLPRYLTGALHARSVERDPKLWVVGSAFGPADGALAFYLAATQLPDAPRVVWLSKSPSETQLARKLGIQEVADADSSEGYRLTLRAGLATVTHGFGDVNRYALSRATIIQLWHGSPLKKLHADSPAVTALGGLERIPGVSALMRSAYRRGTSRISLLPCSSSLFVPFFASAFHLVEGQVQVLGEPRTDVLFAGSTTERIAAAKTTLAPFLGRFSESRVVLYAPTWRDGDPDPGVPTPAQWQRIGELCERLDLVLLIRPHPLGVGEYTHVHERVRMVAPADQPESMPLLWGVDALVTDYSSILVDYAVTGRPILLLAPDLESYRQTRGLYVDYEWLSGGAWSTDWDQVLDRMESVFTLPEAAMAASAHSRHLAPRFHEWTDAGSALRVAQAAARLAGSTPRGRHGIR
ncbi:MAG TPA: CDP-glycerol glycerophosphotransferase family protein [Propionicimonas sp.]|nr:CDP-glycerol glycerophosphotransferase family protein [Propionicimonas sp.]HRA07312.1 CDP-glycerol glycerophosphotransferase family protein [Propionicimonas sp.]